MLESIDWTIIGPAFAAGLIVLSTHVPLGQEVLKRGISEKAEDIRLLCSSS